MALSSLEHHFWFISVDFEHFNQGLRKGFELTGSIFFTTLVMLITPSAPISPQITELLLLMDKNWRVGETYSKSWGYLQCQTPQICANAAPVNWYQGTMKLEIIGTYGCYVQNWSFEKSHVSTFWISKLNFVEPILILQWSTSDGRNNETYLKYIIV